MADEYPRRYADSQPRRRRPPQRDPIDSRPDRLAMWAVVMAVVAMLAAAASAKAEVPAEVPVGAASTAAALDGSLQLDQPNTQRTR